MTVGVLVRIGTICAACAACFAYAACAAAVIPVAAVPNLSVQNAGFLTSSAHTRARDQLPCALGQQSVLCCPSPSPTTPNAQPAKTPAPKTPSSKALAPKTPTSKTPSSQVPASNAAASKTSSSNAPAFKIPSSSTLMLRHLHHHLPLALMIFVVAVVPALLTALRGRSPGR